jgi:hypothetical protein
MNTLDLDTIILKAGKHDSPDDGGCIIEWASYLAGQPWSDTPPCVAPSIRSFCISWNDSLPDADRTRLLAPFIPKVIGTNTTAEDETTRAWMACDWLVRTFTSTWLRKAGLVDDALALEALPELTSAELANAAMPAIETARKKSAAAGDAAWDAAGDAAGDAAWDAARAAAWDAAGDAAWDALRPTVELLQASALDLVERMAWLKDGAE